MMLGDAPAFGTTRQNQRRAQYSACGAAGSEVKVERGVALGKIDTFPQFAQFLIDQCEPGGSKRSDIGIKIFAHLRVAHCMARTSAIKHRILGVECD